MRPRLLDLFCCAGGAAVGYARAGFEVVGVDVVHQPSYPYEFIQADAIQVLADLASGCYIRGTWFRLRDFAALHGSPPCQGYTPLNAYNHAPYPDLVAATGSRRPGCPT